MVGMKNFFESDAEAVINSNDDVPDSNAKPVTALAEAHGSPHCEGPLATHHQHHLAQHQGYCHKLLQQLSPTTMRILLRICCKQSFETKLN